MAASPPRRKFMPEPIETSTRSSKRAHHDGTSQSPHMTSGAAEGNAQVGAGAGAEEIKANSTKPRRFLPQPVEESSRTSRRAKVEHIEDAAESSKPAESSTQAPPRRRFAPEPVETSSKSSRKKFALEPVESSARSSKDRESKDGAGTISPQRRHFLPEPVETTSSRRRQRPKSPEDDDSRSPSPASRSSSGGRRFTPELVATAKGSYRRSLVSPTQRSPDQSKPSSPPSSSGASEATDSVSEIQESRFSAASLAKRQHEIQRQRSFMVPNLPIIESDESGEDSETPSLSDIQSDSSASLDRPQTRDQPDGDTYTDYVLRLAAKSAHRQLQNQAMAAYINERVHEPVDHFAIDHDDDEDGPIHVGRLSGDNGADPKIFRRDSEEDLRWELENARRHHSQLEEAKRDLKANTAGQSRFSSAALLARQNHGIGAKLKKRDSTRTRIKKSMMRGEGGANNAPDKDTELAKMRSAASPPMLGDDLVFPITTSPKMTRCETDQHPRPRTAEKDEDDSENGEIRGEPGLWSTSVNVSNRNSAGLWMGMCTQSQQPSRPVTPIRSGIQTPAHDVRNPFDATTPSGRPATPGRRTGKPYLAHFLPLTPPRSQDGEDEFTSSIDRKLMLERQIEEEFPDRVITQIYNYLSLGYPVLARPFDPELSKIARISVDELRKDDAGQDAKGYVGAPEGEGVDEAFVIGKGEGTKGGCRRWEALRLYVREWARQSPAFKNEPFGVRGNGEWGARARRGSWAH